MHPLKRWECYLVAFLILVTLSSAEQVIDLKVDFYKNGNIFLKEVKISEGKVTEFDGGVRDAYLLQITDQEERLVYETYLKPTYAAGNAMASLFLEIPYEESYDTLTIKKGDRIYIRKSIPVLLCNLDKECNNFETPQTCVEDCALQTLKTCSADNLCDLKCSVDPDCPMNSSMNWMHFILVLMITGLVIFGLTEYKRIRAKHILLRQFNLPSQAAIGVVPAKVAPTSGSVPAQVNKPS